MKTPFRTGLGPRPDDDVPWAAIATYVAGSATDQERALVETWCTTHHEASGILYDLQTAVGEIRRDRHRRLASRWADFRSLVDVFQDQPPTQRRQVEPSGRRRIRPMGHGTPGRGWWATAIVLTLAVMTGIVWQAGRLTIGRQAPVVPMIYATANAQRAHITLPDGNTVSLGVASRLEVPSNYALGNRTVRLTGQALFTIAHRGQAPFSVVSGREAIRVLGTRFVVQHYAGDSLTTVAVREGRVMVRSAVVGPEYQATLDARGRVRVTAADPSKFSFATGTLVLNDVTFRDAIAELDRWYDADIRLGDPALGRRRVAGEYGPGSLADLSDILSGTYDVRVERVGRVLTLYPK